MASGRPGEFIEVYECEMCDTPLVSEGFAVVHANDTLHPILVTYTRTYRLEPLEAVFKGVTT